MKILPKELLSIADVAIYLNNLGFDYDLNQPMSYKKLLVDIFELKVQKNIPILFRYTGEIESHIDVYTDIEDMRIEEVFPTNVDSLITPTEASGFFYLNNDKHLRNILIEQKDIQLQGFFTPVDNRYIVSTLQSDLFISKYKEGYEIRQAYYINKSDHLKVEDLLIPIESLNTLFKVQVNTGASLEDCLTLKSKNEALEEKLRKATCIYKKQKARIESLENQINKLSSQQPSDESLKAVPHQSYRTVDRIMYALAKLTEIDNSSPYSRNAKTLNEAITTVLQNDGIPLEYEAVGKWLARVNNIKPANKK